jgi:hypothetical protein
MVNVLGIGGCHSSKAGSTALRMRWLLGRQHAQLHNINSDPALTLGALELTVQKDATQWLRRGAFLHVWSETGVLAIVQLASVR